MIKSDFGIHQNIINIVQMNNITKSQKYKELKQIISEKRKELKIRKQKLQYNMIVMLSS